MGDYMVRFGVPGQNPSQPIEDGMISDVYDPWTGIRAGQVLSNVSQDKLTITNTTLPGHILHDGQITRTAWQNSDGSWSVETIGIGNNDIPGMASVNEWAGPSIFDEVDRQMREYIDAHQRRAW
jgi:hypothetical protein